MGVENYKFQFQLQIHLQMQIRFQVPFRVQEADFFISSKAAARGGFEGGGFNETTRRVWSSYE